VSHRLIIFDSDGTLADTLPWMRSVFNELAEEHRFRKVAPQEFEAFRDLHGRELLRRLELGLPRFDGHLGGGGANQKAP
jgi:phosphoglycolate phosphatase